MRRRLAGRPPTQAALLSMEVGTPLFWHRGDMWMKVEYLGPGTPLRDGVPRYYVQHEVMGWTHHALASELRTRKLDSEPCVTCGR